MKKSRWRAGPSWMAGATCGLAMLGLLSVAGCNKAPAPAPPVAKKAAATSTSAPQTTAQPGDAKPTETSPADGILLSGLQPGDFAGVYHVKDITGPAAGQSVCYR